MLKNSKKQPKDKQSELKDAQQKVEELTNDLQRTHADFENYRKRTENDLERARDNGRSGAIMKLLPVIDNIERAIAHVPKELKGNKWAQSVTGLVKNLEKSLESLDVKRIDAKPGAAFNPELHEAVSSESGDGDEEVIAEELQAGYTLNGRVIRHSMVKVKS